MTTRVAAVMTVFNRRDTTLGCLASIREQTGADAEVDVYVLDDASTDGTAEAIKEQFPEVHLLHGDGNQFWVGGMRGAFGAAIERGYDAYWWLNDDTHLKPDALALLLASSAELRGRGHEQAVVVGTTTHPDDGRFTYGGVRRPSRLRPLDLELVPPASEPREALTFNGNCVLIPHSVVELVGNIDPAYRQKMGDFDYGFRTRSAGGSVWVAPGTIGTCATHPPRRTDQAPLRDELRRLWSVKELPFGPWATFTRRWAGPAWPIFMTSPYVKRAAHLVWERLRARPS